MTATSPQVGRIDVLIGLEGRALDALVQAIADAKEGPWPLRQVRLAVEVEEDEAGNAGDWFVSVKVNEQSWSAPIRDGLTIGEDAR